MEIITSNLPGTSTTYTRSPPIGSALQNSPYSRRRSSATSNGTRQVRFSEDILVVNTFHSEEYDRSAMEVMRLSFQDAVDLYTFKSELNRQYKCLHERRQSKDASDSDSSLDGSNSEVYSPVM